MGFMLRPVCVKHQKEYKVEEQGVALVEYADRGGELKPYAIYFADLWVCPVCGHQIIGGYGEPAAREHEREKLQRLIDTWTDLGKIHKVS